LRVPGRSDAAVTRALKRVAYNRMSPRCAKF
jgi:hypothetical protein